MMHLYASRECHVMSGTKACHDNMALDNTKLHVELAEFENGHQMKQGMVCMFVPLPVIFQTTGHVQLETT